jgi:hypothetical protein
VAAAVAAGAARLLLLLLLLAALAAVVAAVEAEGLHDRVSSQHHCLVSCFCSSRPSRQNCMISDIMYQTNMLRGDLKLFAGSLIQVNSRWYKLGLLKP